jgi:phage protein D
MTEQAYVSTSPVFKVDGQAKGELARDLIRLQVEETTQGLKTLSLHLAAIGPAASGSQETLQYLDGSIVDFGKQLEVSIGPSGDERVIFKGTVSAVEIAYEEGQMPLATVFAEDDLMKLRMTRRMKTYEQVSDADIATAVAGDHGLSADVAADGPTYDVVQQWNQSDLAFLRDRARLIQAEIWVVDGSLKFKTRPNRTATAITLVQGNQLISASLRADLAHQRSSVTVSGYDAQQRAVIDQQAAASVIQSEISGGRTGPTVLSQALGQMDTYRVREEPLLDAEATSWAKAEMLRRCRQFVTVVGTTSGTPDMVVGSALTLQRVGSPFEGSGYYVTRVRHVYDLIHGHRTKFDAERATVNQP